MAQRKITEPSHDQSDSLPELTSQQAKFVEGLLKGMSASDAYRGAYDTDNSLPNTIWSSASRLRSEPKVAAWLSAARKNGLGTATVTLEGHLQELERLKAIAIDTGNVGAAVQAEQLRGKAAGHYVEKHQDVTASMDITQTLNELAKEGVEGRAIAEAFAAKEQIPWTADEGATKH